MKETMKYIFLSLCVMCCNNALAQFHGLTSGQYVLSENINTINAKTKQPEVLTVIETLDIMVKKTREIMITPIDSKSKYFTDARGYADTSGNIQFGFTYAKGPTIFSINYDGKLNEEGYFKGSLICIYPKSEAAIKGEWAMKKINKQKSFMNPDTGF